ncbi:MAG: cupin domain-containing protein [Halofilum sp. (in: g-proteobacteria)]
MKSTCSDAELLGQRLRSARRQSGSSLREVADRARCSESLLSKVENGRANPSLSMLHRIVAALGMSMTTLFGEGDENPRVVTRRSERPRIRLQSRGAREIALERLITDTGDHLLQANIHVVGPGGDSQGQITHEGEELGYLLEGSLELIVDGEPYRLEAGDSFVFRSELPHAYRNIGEGDARILWVNTPATF